MAKTKNYFQCQNCGGTTKKWQGQCPDCGEWNTLQETIATEKTKANKRRQTWTGISTQVTDLSKVENKETDRISTQIKEFDNVLGGGIVRGSVTLVGGDPGIGKSTLLLQIMLNIKNDNKVLYITGEESLQQVASRARRIADHTENLKIVAETDFEVLSEIIKNEQPELIIVDSIQTIYSDQFDSAPGTVTQVRECTSYLTQISKNANIATMIVGHVTKDGAIAGPKVLEHIVDVILSFEGNNKNNIRLLKPQKNRFGSTNEAAAFTLENKGMIAVANPATLFLDDNHQSVPGSCIFAMQEGQHCLFLEVQALIDDSQSRQKVLTVGTEFNRTSMVMAVLYKKLNLDDLSYSHIYVNAVGGLRITDTGVDLAVACAALTAIRDKALPEQTVVFGEIGLTGKVRGVSDIDKKLKESAANGFDNVIMPNVYVQNSYGLQLIKIKYVSELLTVLNNI